MRTLINTSLCLAPFVTGTVKPVLIRRSCASCTPGSGVGVVVAVAVDVAVGVGVGVAVAVAVGVTATTLTPKLKVLKLATSRVNSRLSPTAARLETQGMEEAEQSRSRVPFLNIWVVVSSSPAGTIDVCMRITTENGSLAVHPVAVVVMTTS